MSSGESNEVLDVITSRDFRKQYQTFHPEEVKQILAGFQIPAASWPSHPSALSGHIAPGPRVRRFPQHLIIRHPLP